MLWTNATAKRWRVYEVKQTIPLFGGKPALYVEVEGRRQAIPPLLGAKPGDFIAVIPQAATNQSRCHLCRSLIQIEVAPTQG